VFPLEQWFAKNFFYLSRVRSPLVSSRINNTTMRGTGTRPEWRVNK
jgi:hypothetical protein